MALTAKDKTKHEREIARQLLDGIRANIEQLIDIISAQNPEFVGFEIEEILRVDEAKSMNGGIESLNVTRLDEWHYCNRVLNSWGQFNKDYEISPIFNFRLPGFVVIKEDNKNVAALVTRINSDKKSLHALVMDGRKHYIARSEFIHSIDASLISEQVYREISLIPDEVKTVWFNWATRPTPKIFTIEEFEKHIISKRKKVPIEYSETQWHLKMEHLEKICRSGKYKSIHRFKRRQAFPVIELNFAVKGMKRHQRTATTPYILNGQVNGAPSFTALKTYSKADMFKHETITLPDNKEWIDEDLKLIGIL